MRRCLGLILIAVCALAGCRETAQSLTPSALMERMRAMRPGHQPDLPQVQVALIRLPLGDRYLNKDLWAEVDENVLPERRDVYEANGFRMGTICGTLPAELHRLLTDEKTCVSSRQVGVQPGKWFFLPLGAGEPIRELSLRQDGEVTQARYEKAQCGLGLQIEPKDQGRSVLRFEPRIQHGSSQILAKPTEDRTRLAPLIGRPEEKFAKLGFEFELSPNDYLIIGALLQGDKTLGRACLTQTEAETNAQFVLVVRSLPAKSGAAKSASFSATQATPGAAVPLAIQSLALPPAKPSSPYAVRGQPD